MLYLAGSCLGLDIYHLLYTISCHIIKKIILRFVCVIISYFEKYDNFY